VHLFGLPTDMDEILNISRGHNIHVIEDCAQAFGAQYRGRYVGSMGDCGCFSFYPSKNLGAYGDSGMMSTNDPDINERVRLLRNHGTVAPYRHDFIGYNSRLDEIQAAILRIKLRHIEEYNKKRRRIAAIYTSMLKDAVICPVERPDRTHVYHQYTIRSQRRELIIRRLREKRISHVIYYPIPLHLQRAFKYLGYRAGDFPESERASREVLSIPIYPELPPETAEFVAKTILDALK